MVNKLNIFKQKKLSIGVLQGGFSSEREISLKSGQAVVKALRSVGHQVIPIDVTGPKIKELAGIEVAFIALHGKFGEDGELQAILDKKNIPYTGSGAPASHDAMDKFRTKELFVQQQVPTPEYITFSRQGSSATLHEKIDEWGYPVVFKPKAEGSTVGVSIVHDYTFVPGALNRAFKCQPEVLVEKYIKGRELTVGILAEQALPIIEICPKRGFYDYEAKYQDTATEYIVNPDLSAGLAEKIQAVGLKAHQVLGCAGFSRVDIRLSEQNEPFVLEVNTIPGLTERSLLPKAAEVAGINFTQLCEKIIELALAKK
ncbi:MAG: D-alanine--D-alanine ligase [Planctomycetes bacterium]|nr:D-alanine--D-alanine ligase [Planctomycetota bacterium]